MWGFLSPQMLLPEVSPPCQHRSVPLAPVLQGEVRYDLHKPLVLCIV